MPTRLRGNTNIALSSVCFLPVCGVNSLVQLLASVGFFMGANPQNNRSIESQFLSLAMSQQQCLDAFPEGAVPPEPKVQVLDDKYGGWFMNPTHVFFTNGEIDPWRTLSVASFEENAPKRIGSLNIPA